VADGAHVHMRFGSFKSPLCHFYVPLSKDTLTTVGRFPDIGTEAFHYLLAFAIISSAIFLGTGL
jgi:hypothetical protein